MNNFNVPKYVKTSKEKLFSWLYRFGEQFKTGFYYYRAEFKRLPDYLCQSILSRNDPI